MSLVYIMLGDDRCAVAKLFKSRVWERVPQGTTLIFGDALMSLQCMISGGKHVCKKTA